MQREWKDETNQWHREHGPALIYSDGMEVWYKHGQMHRLDGPAKIWLNGWEEWFIDGKCHRVDGPAGIYPGSGGESLYWCINGVNITDEVTDWIKEFGMPSWKEWSLDDWMMFNLRFR